MKKISECSGRNETKNPEKLLLSACLNNNADYMASLLEKGADPDTVDSINGRSLLHIAAAKNYVRILSLLISSGADVNHKDLKGKTPLYDTVYNGGSAGLETAQKLIEAGADVNSQDEDGWTPLHLSVNSNKTEMAGFLLKAGADPNILNNIGLSPLYISLVNSSIRCAELMLLHSGDIKKEIVPALMQHAIRAGDKEMVCKLASEWDNWAEPAYKSKYPLFKAAQKRDICMIRLLLELGAGTTADEFTDALAIATINQDIDIVRILLEHGADPNLYTTIGFRDGTLPLIEAARKNNAKMIGLLLNYGADVLLKGRHGESLLPAAVGHGSDKVITVLVKAGADINAIDGNNFTSLHLAAMRGNISLIFRLIRLGADIDLKDSLNRTVFNILQHYHYRKYEKNKNKFIETAEHIKNKRIKKEDLGSSVPTGFEFDI